MRTAIGLISTVFTVLANVSVVCAVAPYTEQFAVDAANWADGSGMALVNYVPSGGPDGSSYASTSASTSNTGDASTPLVLFRAQDEFNSSNHAFEGDWITSGINRFSVFVRHSAPDPLSYFIRFATPGNFPGIAGIKPTQVPSGTWTELSFDITLSNGNVELFPEGPPSVFDSQFNTVFSNLGHIQVGVSLPPNSGAAGPFTFDIDQPSISIVPEPASGLFALLGFIAIPFWRRRRRD